MHDTVPTLALGLPAKSSAVQSVGGWSLVGLERGAKPDWRVWIGARVARTHTPVDEATATKWDGGRAGRGLRSVRSELLP
jgi:hypothetical protein